MNKDTKSAIIATVLLVVALLLVIIFLTPAKALTEQKIIKTDVEVKIENCQVKIDTEDDDADKTITIPSPTCNTTNPYVSESTLTLAFLRNVSFEDVDVVNLTMKCVEFFGQTDYISNYTDCRESKGRLEENYANLNEKWASVDGIASNKTTELDACNSLLTNSKTSLDACYTSEADYKAKSEKYGQDRLTFSLLAFLLGISAHVMWIRRVNTGRKSFPKQEKAVADIRIDEDL